MQLCFSLWLSHNQSSSLDSFLHCIVRQHTVVVLFSGCNDSPPTGHTGELSAGSVDYMAKSFYMISSRSRIGWRTCQCLSVKSYKFKCFILLNVAPCCDCAIVCQTASGSECLLRNIKQPTDPWTQRMTSDQHQPITGQIDSKCKSHLIIVIRHNY